MISVTLLFNRRVKNICEWASSRMKTMTQKIYELNIRVLEKNCVVVVVAVLSKFRMEGFCVRCCCRRRRRSRLRCRNRFFLYLTFFSKTFGFYCSFEKFYRNFSCTLMIINRLQGNCRWIYKNQTLNDYGKNQKIKKIKNFCWVITLLLFAPSSTNEKNDVVLFGVGKKNGDRLKFVRLYVHFSNRSRKHMISYFSHGHEVAAILFWLAFIFSSFNQLIDGKNRKIRHQFSFYIPKCRNLSDFSFFLAQNNIQIQSWQVLEKPKLSFVHRKDLACICMSVWKLFSSDISFTSRFTYKSQRIEEGLCHSHRMIFNWIAYIQNKINNKIEFQKDLRLRLIIIFPWQLLMKRHAVYRCCWKSKYIGRFGDEFNRQHRCSYQETHRLGMWIFKKIIPFFHWNCLVMTYFFLSDPWLQYLQRWIQRV